MKQIVWVIERKVDGMWSPCMVYLKRDNARHHAAGLKSKPNQPPYRVSRYVFDPRIRNARKGAKSVSSAAIATGNWPSVSLELERLAGDEASER